MIEDPKLAMQAIAFSLFVRIRSTFYFPEEGTLVPKSKLRIEDVGPIGKEFLLYLGFTDTQLKKLIKTRELLPQIFRRLNFMTPKEDDYDKAYRFLEMKREQGEFRVSTFPVVDRRNEVQKAIHAILFPSFASLD
jgi:hypothetical protein